MLKYLMLGVGIIGGYMLATRGMPKSKGDNERSKVNWASSAYGAGSASLTPPPQPSASTMYSAGTASLPFAQQAIRDPDTVR